MIWLGRIEDLKESISTLAARHENYCSLADHRNNKLNNEIAELKDRARMQADMITHLLDRLVKLEKNALDRIAKLENLEAAKQESDDESLVLTKENRMLLYENDKLKQWNLKLREDTSYWSADQRAQEAKERDRIIKYQVARIADLKTENEKLRVEVQRCYQRIRDCKTVLTA